MLFVDGTMVDGPNVELPFGVGAFAGADALTAALEQCRTDSTIAAVVLRVNSPGGSAFASDVLAREIKKVRAAGKPIVVSMGDMAASGGYYISAPADVIYADPSTLSGSIGIFSYKGRRAEAAGDAGDQRRDLSSRRPRPTSLSPYRPWTDAERALAEQQIRHLYDLFVATVAEGRRTRGSPSRASTSSVAATSGPARRRRGWGSSIGWAASSAAIDEAARLGGVPPRPTRPDAGAGVAAGRQEGAPAGGWWARRRCSRPDGADAADAQAFGDDDEAPSESPDDDPP